jgi:hypothetical protein
MKCLECDYDMQIDEWNAWQWTCPYCDTVGRVATKEEIAVYEEDMQRLMEKMMEAFDSVK